MPIDTTLAVTYNEGKTVDFIKVTKRNKNFITVIVYSSGDTKQLNINSSIDAGFSQSNYFTYNNKPELFNRIKNELDLINKINLFFPLHSLSDFSSNWQ